jgi:hypothetical protein
MKAVGRAERSRRLREARLDRPETAWKDCGMNARLTAAALWAAVGCLPRSDDLGAYSAQRSPGVADGAGDGGLAGASSAAGVAGAPGAGFGDAASDAVVGGGSLPGGGMGGAAMSGAGAGNSPDGMGGSTGGADACADGILSADATRCYIVSSAGAAWRDANEECEVLGGALAKVETAEEDAFLATLLAVNLWLGASDTAAENVFVWSDGTAIEFGNWGPNQPDRFPGPDCVEKRDTPERQWFDQPCDNERAFVCERVMER